MIEPFLEALQFTFMRHALLAGLLTSVACGVIGAFVVVNRLVFISGGIAHAAYGGVGLGYFVKYNVLPVLLAGAAVAPDPRPGYWPIAGAVLFSLAAALAMGWVQRKTRERADTVIGALWAIGMSVGIILVDRTAGYKSDLLSYLFGSILAVSAVDLWIMLALDVLIVVLVVAFYQELLAISFDETLATAKNIPVGAIQLTLLCLIALAVVMLMRVVGLIMVIAMLTIPAAISNQFVKKMDRMILVAIVLGACFTTVGLGLSYLWNLTSGATIVLVAGGAYLLSLALRAARRRRRPPLAG